MFNMSEDETGRFCNENERYTKSEIRSFTLKMLNGPLIETLGVTVAVILLWYGGRQVLSGKGFSAEDFIRYLVLLVASYQPFKRLANMSASMQSGLAGAERVSGLLDIKCEPLVPFNAAGVPAFNCDIAFNDVRFTYPGCEEEVLRKVSFTIKKGDVVALVGSSGGGKSTILDLLPRFYDICGGSIKIDGRDTRECDLAGLRNLFGIVSQETVLFNDTVANNISYGFQNANEAEIRAAAAAANASEFIAKLPLGMNAVIGEKGEMLSGGQRQRLAIARALLRNPPVLILDEATSALDTESERLVQNAIDRVMENRTVLVVAHRLSTILHADSIMVLEDGCIVEQGRHQELLLKGGRYRQLYDLQFGKAPGTTPA
jgi:subfamily B ATP-binding cassette protein MsbA